MNTLSSPASAPEPTHLHDQNNVFILIQERLGRALLCDRILRPVSPLRQDSHPEPPRNARVCHATSDIPSSCSGFTELWPSGWTAGDEAKFLQLRTACGSRPETSPPNTASTTTGDGHALSMRKCLAGKSGAGHKVRMLPPALAGALDKELPPTLSWLLYRPSVTMSQIPRQGLETPHPRGQAPWEQEAGHTGCPAQTLGTQS